MSRCSVSDIVPTIILHATRPAPESGLYLGVRCFRMCQLFSLCLIHLYTYYFRASFVHFLHSPFQISSILNLPTWRSWLKWSRRRSSIRITATLLYTAAAKAPSVCATCASPRCATATPSVSYTVLRSLSASLNLAVCGAPNGCYIQLAGQGLVFSQGLFWPRKANVII